MTKRLDATPGCSVPENHVWGVPSLTRGEGGVLSGVDEFVRGHHILGDDMKSGAMTCCVGFFRVSVEACGLSIISGPGTSSRATALPYPTLAIVRG